MRYVVRIWESFLAAHPDARTLPAVLPVVVHHGDAKWSAATELSELLDLAPDARLPLAEYLPHFRFLLDDIAAEDEDTLRTRSLTALATAALLLLQHARQATDLLAGLERWRDVLARVLASPNGDEAFAALLKFTLQGKAEGKAELLLRQLGIRFGPLPRSVVERIQIASPPSLDDWAERVLTAQSLDDVFR